MVPTGIDGRGRCDGGASVQVPRAGLANDSVRLGVCIAFARCGQVRQLVIAVGGIGAAASIVLGKGGSRRCLTRGGRPHQYRVITSRRARWQSGPLDLVKDRRSAAHSAIARLDQIVGRARRTARRTWQGLRTHGVLHSRVPRVGRLRWVNKVDSLFGGAGAGARSKRILLLVVVAAAHGGLRHDYLAHGLVLED
jgi:hypothetical protein